MVKQVSVFIENRKGRLEEVTEILGKNQINILALSLADTSEYGMMRMLVTDPILAKKVLKEADFSVMLTEVMAVRIPNQPGALHKLLHLLTLGNVEYMYAYGSKENANMILKLTNPQEGQAALTGTDYKILDEAEAYQGLE